MKKPTYHFPIFRAENIASEADEYTRRLAQIRASALELLRVSEPDTFLGRQHYPLPPGKKNKASAGKSWWPI